MYDGFNQMIQEIQGKHEDETDKLKKENNLLKGSLNGLQIENNLLQNIVFNQRNYATYSIMNFKRLNSSTRDAVIEEQKGEV